MHTVLQRTLPSSSLSLFHCTNTPSMSLCIAFIPVVLLELNKQEMYKLKLHVNMSRAQISFQVYKHYAIGDIKI